MRLTLMRTFPSALVAAITVLLAAGCDNTPAPSANYPDVPPTGPAPPASAAPSTAAPTAAPADDSEMPRDPEMPRDKVGAPIVLAGTVRTEGSCRILTSKGRRWALLGVPVAQLADGQRVTVRGRPAGLPDGCDAAAALQVQRVDEQ
ncbi:DUF5818 domain-containing protein [Mangrovihabitans endophyticus]|uniref:Uncharacterized protein n=1 Tax=Mangrovihabitans endophyticus TaxID=1751298 RepID=A0A8J3FRJ9_9ACTN|nr:DUF5818 domain-containing protein [Mangrovihabitans endophyticus]GGL09996.1 hypothetical protein GCM10012284_50930 [Mangrovihabitans endophyticus]